MTKRKSLITGLIFAVLAIVFFIFVRASTGQEVITSIGAVSGNVYEKTSFSQVTQIGDNVFYKDSYQSNFRAINANLTFDKNFSPSGVTTNITGVAAFSMRGKEVIGTEQVELDGVRCCGAASGSSFFVSGIEYKSQASPGGTGECCGVNFSMEVPQGEGRIEGASIYIGQSEVDVGSEEKSELVYGTEYHKTSIETSGVVNDFKFQNISAECNPAEDLPRAPFYKFILCTGSPTGLNPWEITP